MPEPQSGSGPRRRTATGSPEQTQEPPADSTRHPRAGDTSRAGDALPVSKETFTEFPFFLGRYRVEKFLGSGAMGAVYLAEDTKLDRKVALKVPKLDGVDADKLLRRMEIEAKSLAKIEHPHVCRVLDFDQQEGVHFIAMEYIPGEELQDILKRIGKKRKPKEAVQIILQLAKGLEAAHSSGIIHRDLKPGNVRRREDGRMVIMDFGLARQTQVAADAERTQGGTILGSAAYMSPEQANGRVDDIDESSDLYALGVMLFELLTGEWPFQGSAMQVIGRKTVLDPPNPLTLAPEIPVPLADICLKMLARSQADRYSRCADVIRDLKSIDWKASVPDIPSILDIKSIDPNQVGDMNVNAAPAPNKAPAMNILPAMSGEFPGPNVALDVVKDWAGGLSGPAAPTRKRKAGRSSRRNSFQNQVLNWWKTQPVPVKWLGYAGLPAALLTLMVVFFFQTEQGVLRIEIDDPTLSVHFDGRTVTFDQAGQPIKVNPTKQHTLEVQKDGITVDGGSREITVKRGENRLIKVSLLDGRVMIDDGSIAPSPVFEKPQPLSAPFTTVQARAGQEAWAKALGTTVVAKNSIGMDLVLIPPGEFLMGAGTSEAGHAAIEETPQQVRLTRPFRMGATEVTQAEYQQVMGSNPSGFSTTGANSQLIDGQVTARFPVESVSWYDAIEFCNKLSEREGLPPYYALQNVRRDNENKVSSAEVSFLKNGGYRLPTDAEWEYACRAGTTTPFHFGNSNNGQAANLDGRFPYSTSQEGPYLKRTTNVASYRPNAFGLWDMHGNVREWCGDWYDLTFYSQWALGIAIDPFNSKPGNLCVSRGGSWNSNASSTRSAFRHRDATRTDSNNVGFRVARSEDESPATRIVSSGNLPPSPPAEAIPLISPFTAEQAKTGQESWARKLGTSVVHKNSIGMDLVLIPPGEFLMGSPASETGRDANETQHMVRLTRPYRMGATEVTVGQFRRFVDATGYLTEAEKDGNGGSGWNEAKQIFEVKTSGHSWRSLGFSQNDNHPVVNVSWIDAQAFLEWLGRVEGKEYRLPTEAEWEYACRAGTITTWWYGNTPDLLAQTANVADSYGKERWGKNYAKFNYVPVSDGDGFTAIVGNNGRSNPFGLSDMHGNVWEWCADGYHEKFYSQTSGIAIDPLNDSPSRARMVRGGSWFDPASASRSADRHRALPGDRHCSFGFRVARYEDGSSTLSSTSGDSSTPSAAVATSPAMPASLEQVAGNPTTPVSPSNSGASTVPSGARGGEVREFADRKIRFCWCPPGTFLMGSPAADTEADPDEKPQVSVTFPNGFWMAQTETTQGQWQHVMGTSPWIGKHHYKVGPDYPATFVSQKDAVAYCQKLTDQERQAGRLPEDHAYRLPTEAEWEYACRAGTTTKYSFGNDGGQLKNHAWTRQNAYDIVSERYPHLVGRKKPNPWNLYDTYGNVAEWCADGYVDRLKGGINPKSAGSSLSVLRGGSYFTPAKDTRSAARARHAIGDGSFRDGIGFRVVLASTATTPPQGEAKAVQIAPPETPVLGSPARFVSIFNGRDLTGWQGAIEGYEVQNGILKCKGIGEGTLYSTRRYTDFIVRLEYRLTRGADNGLAIRFPGGTAVPYMEGMGEIQIFDDEDGKFPKLDPRQRNGSVYGMTAASPGVQHAIGQWNDLEVRVEGSSINVKLNGRQVTRHNASSISSFLYNRIYSGRNAKNGFVGFCSNKSVVEFRKIEIQELNELD